MTTKEAIQKKYDILNDDGVVILNIVSAIEGNNGKFLRAEYATYKSVFHEVYLFPVTEKDNATRVQNIILVALKNTKDMALKSDNAELNEYLNHLWTKNITMDIPILTDDFAPVDYYVGKII